MQPRTGPSGRHAKGRAPTPRTAPHSTDPPRTAPHSTDPPRADPHGTDTPDPPRTAPHDADTPLIAPHGTDTPRPDPHDADTPRPDPHDADTPRPDPPRNDPEVIRRLLTTPARWAVVGLSRNPARTAHGIARYLQRDLGMRIVPVHPRAEDVHGETGYRNLREVPGQIDVVDVFVRSELAGAVVDEAIAIGARAVWLQLGVIDADAAARALSAGLDVVIDTCPAIEAPAFGLP